MGDRGWGWGWEDGGCRMADARWGMGRDAEKKLQE